MGNKSSYYCDIAFSVQEVPLLDPSVSSTMCNAVQDTFIDQINQSRNLFHPSKTNPKYWDDEQASDVREAYGEDWEKIAAFTYDGVDYTMVKILEPVLVLAKEDPVSPSLSNIGSRMGKL
jgi:hypothetical protein